MERDLPRHGMGVRIANAVRRAVTMRGNEQAELFRNAVMGTLKNAQPKDVSSASLFTHLLFQRLEYDVTDLTRLKPKYQHQVSVPHLQETQM